MAWPPAGLKLPTLLAAEPIAADDGRFWEVPCLISGTDSPRAGRWHCIQFKGPGAACLARHGTVAEYNPPTQQQVDSEIHE